MKKLIIVFVLSFVVWAFAYDYRTDGPTEYDRELDRIRARKAAEVQEKMRGVHLGKIRQPESSTETRIETRTIYVPQYTPPNTPQYTPQYQPPPKSNADLASEILRSAKKEGELMSCIRELTKRVEELEKQVKELENKSKINKAQIWGVRNKLREDAKKKLKAFQRQEKASYEKLRKE